MLNLYSGWEGRVKPTVSGVLTPDRGVLATVAGNVGPIKSDRVWRGLYLRFIQ
jgi:hypothetical protein